MRDQQAEGDVERLTTELGQTPRGNVLGIAPISHEERVHLEWIELHECPECGAFIASCRLHPTELSCEACGIVL